MSEQIKKDELLLPFGEAVEKMLTFDSNKIFSPAIKRSCNFVCL